MARASKRLSNQQSQAEKSILPAARNVLAKATFTHNAFLLWGLNCNSLLAATLGV
jgi:hypothetical protein